MTYAMFLVVFIVPWIILGCIYLKRNHRQEIPLISKGLLFLCSMAMIYTTPWDNYLVKNNIWWYGADRVIAVIGYVPVEEYLFFVLQTIMTGFFLFLILNKLPIQIGQRYLLPRILGSFFFLLTTIIGLWMCLESTTWYLGLIVGWASPVVLLQWAFGGDIFWQNKKSFLISIMLPTLYLWIADAIAIHLNIWTISSKYTTGFKIGILPIEEAIFFLMTNMMVVQGLKLFWYFSEKFQRDGSSWQSLLRPT